MVKNLNLQRSVERLKKRAHRAKLKVKTDSPRSKVKQRLHRGSKNEIAKKLVFAETVHKTLCDSFRTQKVMKAKNILAKVIKDNKAVFQKYKLIDEMRCISSRIFRSAFVHRSNNVLFRNR